MLFLSVKWSCISYNEDMILSSNNPFIKICQNKAEQRNKLRNMVCRLAQIFKIEG